MWIFSHHLPCIKYVRQLDRHRFKFTTQLTTGRYVVSIHDGVVNKVGSVHAYKVPLGGSS